MAVNKMFIMLPVMLLARKLNAEDPQTVFLLRAVYGIVQLICGIIVLYTYYMATQVKSMQMIYVPPPAMVRLLEFCKMTIMMDSALCLLGLSHCVALTPPLHTQNSHLESKLTPRKSTPKSLLPRMFYRKPAPCSAHPSLESS